jgi:hypothetical protein
VLDVSYVRFVTKVSGCRTIYAAFAAFNLIHNGARTTNGVYLYLFLHTATLKAHWGFSKAEVSLNGLRFLVVPRTTIDQGRYSKGGPRNSFFSSGDEKENRSS